jgi:protein tyrosine/serine phosphatase
MPPTIDINPSVPFNQAYWVKPDLFMAGCYPGAEHSDDAQEKLKSLLEHGIGHIINLMESAEVDRNGKPFVPYEDQMSAIARDMGCNVEFYRRPIRDYGVPTHMAMKKLLDLIDLCIENNQPIYLHCLGGIGRTGTVVGCYLARHGNNSGQKVLEIIRALRRNTATHHRRSPETAQQIELVCSWRQGE